MKLQHIRSRLMILCGLLISALSLAQDIISPNTTNLPFGSSIKGLYHLQEDNDTSGFIYENGTSLAITANETSIDYNSKTFYFWIVENIEHDYFQIYSATQTDKVLSIEKNGITNWVSYAENVEPDTKTKLQFRMYTDGSMRPTDSETIARGHITTATDESTTDVDNDICNCNFLQIEGVSKFYVVASGQGFSDYRSIVFENTTITNSEGAITKEVNADGSSYTRIVQSNSSNETDEYTFASSKFQVSGIGSDDFQLTITSGTEGYIGFLDYIRHDFQKNVFQGARPRLGLKVIDGKISLIYLAGDQELPNGKELIRAVETDIQVGSPFTFGFKDQYTFVANQNGIEYELKMEVPAEFFLNQSITQSARVLVRLLNGEVKIAYTLSNGIIALNEETGTESGEDYMSTDAYMPHNGPGSLLNTFDWQATKWSVRYRGIIGNAIEDKVFSPYNSYERQELHAINNQSSLTGEEFLGGADNEYIEGWELIKANLGYSADGQPKDPAPDYPYVIMYDKMASKLRVFVYTSNLGVSNQLTVELNSNGGIPGGETSYTPKLWGGLQQFKSYDAISPRSYSQVVPFNSTEGRSWYYTDFVMEYDPCLTFFESFIQLSIIKTTKGDLSIVGRSQGGVVTGGTPEYDNWKEDREDFLVGVMQSDASTLEQGLGDITFNKYNEFDVTEFSDTMDGVLVGKDIADWEKEKAKLEWEGADQIADATIAEGSLLVAEGVLKTGEGVTSMGGPLTAPASGGFKAAQGVTTMGRGAAKIVSGEGKAKMASAKKLYYESIKDKVKRSDQDISLKIPKPRPQIVFGELALKGTLSISTTLTTENYIATPGALNSGQTPEWWTNGTRGSEPLYNLPLGQFVLLKQPQFAVGISRGVSNRHQAWLKTKEKPYFAHNDRVRGKIEDIIAIAISVDTYNSSGYAVKSSTSESYTTLFGKGYDHVLTGDHDINRLINWSQIEDNIVDLHEELGLDKDEVVPDEDIQKKLSQWIRVSYEMWSITPSNIQSRNLTRVYANSDIYNSGTTTFDYVSSSNKYYNDILLAAQKIAEGIGDYNFEDSDRWGTNYHVYHSQYENSQDNFYQAMNEYCNQLNPSVIGKAANKIIEDKPIFNTVVTKLEVYPNPAQDVTNFLLRSPIPGQVKISMFDFTGKLLIETTDMMDGANNLEGRINIGTLNSGFYIIRAVLPNNEVITQKVIKK